MSRVFVLTIVALLAVASPGSAGFLISQYYEGTGTNKWIELFNNGPTNVDLSLVTVGLWSNENAEGYKTNQTPTARVTLTGILTPGNTFVLGNTANMTPSSPVMANLNSNTVINFNGNDSIAIFSGASATPFSTANLIDAIGFTNAGNQGPDRSFVRLTADPGFNLTAGSNVTNFSTIWGERTLAVVNAAAPGTDNFIGFSGLPVSLLSVSAVPEPTSLALMLMGALGCGVIAPFRRRNSTEEIPSSLS